MKIKVKADGIKQVESIENGRIEFRKENDRVIFSMPFNGLTDIVLLRR